MSQGMRISLLNPAEEDDGWWEAIRVNRPIETTLYNFMCKNADSVDRTVDGTLAPALVLEDLKTQNLVNERSYATGLLRDLHNHMFSLHAVADEHDFKLQSTAQTFNTDDVTAINGADSFTTLRNGADNAFEMIQRWIDHGHDMVYLRVHGRTGAQLSRLHCNIVSNQEIVFAPEEREARFHTGTGEIGRAMDDHIQAKRGFNSAAHRVPM